jgi:competence ComEA-like helix-hairpin-helix protein
METAIPQPKVIEINGADTSQLRQLRGIGPYYALKIAQYRERLGGFVKAEQLMEIEGIDAARFEMMASQIGIDHTLICKISFRNTDQSTLGKHPYIGPYAARWIVHNREQLGDSVCTLPSLLRRNIIKPQHAEWLVYYLE